MSKFRFHRVLVPVMSDARDAAVCFALATLYLQKRDERRGVNRLAGADDGSDGASVAVRTSVSGKRDDQDDGF